MDHSASPHPCPFPTLATTVFPCRPGHLLAGGEFATGRLVGPAPLGTHGAARFAAHGCAAAASARISSPAAFARIAPTIGPRRNRPVLSLGAITEDGAPANGSDRVLDINDLDSMRVAYPRRIRTRSPLILLAQI